MRPLSKQIVRSALAALSLNAALCFTGCTALTPVRSSTNDRVEIIAVDARDFPQVSVFLSAHYSNGAPLDTLSQELLKFEEHGAAEAPDVISLQRASTLEPERLPPARIFLICDPREDATPQAMRAALRSLVEQWGQSADQFALVVPDPDKEAADDDAGFLRAALKVPLTTDRAAIANNLGRDLLDEYSSLTSPLYDCLERALIEIRTGTALETARTVIVLSSGGEHQGSSDDAVMAQKVLDDLVTLKIPVIVVTYDPPDGDTPPEFTELTALAQATGGSPYHAHVSAGAGPIRTQVLASMNHLYRLDFRSGQMETSRNSSRITTQFSSSSIGTIQDSETFETLASVVEQELIRRIDEGLEGPLANVTDRAGEVIELMSRCQSEVQKSLTAIREGRPQEVATRLGTLWQGNTEKAERSARAAMLDLVTDETRTYLKRLQHGKAMRAKYDRISANQQAVRDAILSLEELKRRASEIRDSAEILALVDRPRSKLMPRVLDFVNEMKNHWSHWSPADRLRFYIPCVTVIEARASRDEIDVARDAANTLAGILATDSKRKLGARVYMVLARANASERKFDAAEENCHTAANHLDKPPELYPLWATVAIESSRFEQADAAIEKLAPNDANKAAELYIKLGDTRKAREPEAALLAYELARELSNARPLLRAEAWYRSGDVHRQSFDDADKMIAAYGAGAVLAMTIKPLPTPIRLLSLMSALEERSGGPVSTAATPKNRADIERIRVLGDRLLSDPSLLTPGDQVRAYKLRGFANIRLDHRVAGMEDLKMSESLSDAPSRPDAPSLPDSTETDS